jgi:hypothetical protein
MKQVAKFTIPLFIIIYIAVGCKSSATPHTLTPVPTATQPPPAPIPTATQLPTMLIPELTKEGSFPIGIYKSQKLQSQKNTWEFFANGTYNYQALTTPESDNLANLEMKLRTGPADSQVKTASGTYTVTGDQITFTPTISHETLPCTDPGTYTWTFDGQALSLKPIEDTCATREWLFETGPWVMQP